MFKTLLWTACAVGFGVFIASYSIAGRTPLQHFEHTWKVHGGEDGIQRLKSNVGDRLEDARDHLTDSAKPHEHHSTEDRAALNKLLTRHSATDS